MGKIFYIMGKSSSGKDTIFRKLQRDETLSLKTIVLYTTRPIRAGETDGETYHFVTEEQLSKIQEEGRVIELREYHTVHGVWKYFTADDFQIDLEKESYLIIGTLESFIKTREYFGEEYLVPIYVEVEDGVRLQRALKRERIQEVPKYTEMCRRFLADSEDFSDEKILQAGIDRRFQNMNFRTCLKEITAYIRKCNM